MAIQEFDNEDLIESSSVKYYKFRFNQTADPLKLKSIIGKEKATIICKNCNQRFTGNFCSYCGQTADTHEINLKSTLHELQHVVFHVDKGLLFTSKELFKRPGHTIREYLNGKRVKHFKPFAYILILSTIYAVINSLFHKSNYFDDLLNGMTDASKENPDPAFAFLIKVLEWMSSHYAYATLVVIPVISSASYICFVKTDQNYFKHLVLNSYAPGQRTVAFLLLFPLTYFITDKQTNDYIETFKFFLGLALTFWTYYQFFNTVNPVKRIILTILSFVLVIMMMMVIIIAILFLSKIAK